MLNCPLSSDSTGVKFSTTFLTSRRSLVLSWKIVVQDWLKKGCVLVRRVMAKQIKYLYEFNGFRLNAVERILQRHGQEIPLSLKVFDLLLTLVERRGQVVTKDQLMNEIWPDTIVEETSLKVYVSTLRKVLGDDGEGGKFIETLPKRGYRFSAAVTRIAYEPGESEFLTAEPDLPDLVIEKHSISQIVIKEEGREEIPQPVPLPMLAAPASSAWLRIPPRRVLAIGGVLMVVLALSWGAWSRWTESVPHIESLAVLPFAMLGHGPDEEHLGLGLADALITRLTNSGGIVVRPTSAVQRFTATDRDPVELGRKLKVDAVLDGNLQRSGERVRLTVQLLNVANGKTLWAQTIEEHAGDAFTLQHLMSERLGNWLTQKLSAEERKQFKKDYTVNPSAFEAYTHGRYFYSKQTNENFEKALGYYRRAIELDPNYALAWTGIADCYYALSATILSLGTKANNNFTVESRAAAERAIALDDSLAEAHLSLGTILTETDYPAAIRELERTLELNPNHAQAHNVFSVMVLGLREFKKATAHAMKARDLDPLSIAINTNLGMALFCDHRYDEAAAQLRKALELEPNLPRARYFLGAVLGMQRRNDEAIAELQKAIELSKGGSVPSCSLAYVYAVAGRRAEAQEILARLQAESESKPPPPVYLAMVYAALGDSAQAFSYLETVKGRTTLNVARADPRFDLIRDDPRFASLFEK